MDTQNIQETSFSDRQTLVVDILASTDAFDLLHILIDIKMSMHICFDVNAYTIIGFNNLNL